MTTPGSEANGKLRRILFMIPYPVTVGFAIGRLIRAFYGAGVQWADSEDAVHFCFTSLDQPRSSDLPPGFTNLFECAYTEGDARASNRLGGYISSRRITTALALDLPVQASCLPALRRAGVTTVISYWGAPMSSPNRGIKLWLKRLEVRYLRPSKPDFFIFESRAMCQLATNGRGIAPEKTAVIPTGVDTAKFRPSTSSAHCVHERFGIPESRKIFVYMGHLHRRKGVHVLLEAMTHIARDTQRDDIHCLLLGNRPHELAEFRAEAVGAERLVTFGGYQKDIPELLTDCYAGVIPSTGWDSFPMSSLEMQACGLPVIASDCQGVPETIAPEITGLVTPAGDSLALARAITRLADSSKLRDDMGQAARVRIEREFTTDHHIARLSRFLASVHES